MCWRSLRNRVAYYIAVESHRPETTNYILHEIERKCNEYAGSPLIGTSAEDLGAGLRTFVQKRSVVTYRLTDYFDLLAQVKSNLGYKVFSHLGNAFGCSQSHQ